MNKAIPHFRAKPLVGTKRIAFVVPEWQQMNQVMNGEAVDAAYILQGNLANGLLAHGHKLKFIAPHNLKEIVCTNDAKNPEIAPRTWSARRWFDFLSRGTWILQKKLGVPYLNVFSNFRLYDACLQCLPGQDVVYERHGLYKVGVALACRRLGLPYVLFVDADDILEHDFMGKSITGLLRWLAIKMMRYNLNAACCIICVSKPMRNHLVANWNVPQDKIVVFPNAVDVQKFHPDPEARSSVRSALGFEANPLIIFVGNFYPWHDVATLLEAFSNILDLLPDTRLILIGDGTQRPSMMQRASEIGIDHTIRFVGLIPHDEIPRWVSAADISVAPYPTMDYDLWFSPMKLFEYMAAGTAVVATGIGQLNEVIIDGYNGLLVPPGDVLAMTAALKKLILDAVLRKQLGDNARIEAIQKYSWEIYLKRLERLFTAVIEGEPVNQI